MNNIKKMIQAAKAKNFADLLFLSQEIEKEIGLHPPAGYIPIKIAFAASFTSKGIKESLFVKCCECGILPAFHTSPYNQYMQEILDADSALYRFNPDLVIVFIDTRSLLGEFYLHPYAISDDERKDWTDEKFKEIEDLIRRLRDNSSARIILHNFEIPLHSPLGILESKQSFGFLESIESLNRRMREYAKKDPRLFIFDYDSFCADIGKGIIMDHKMYYLGDVKLDWNHMPELCRAYMSYIKPLVSLMKKCIVVDLDNTLWGGIVGEDGFDGIRLGPTPEGRPFVEFQRYLLALFNRGILLAVNSRNNFDEAINVIKKHPYMVLREKNFASIKINWLDKISNLKAIAKELNIGLDSLVFIDDDTVNRELVRQALPEVAVMDMPEDPSLYVSSILDMNEFHSMQLTDEDKGRGKLYAEKRAREEFRATMDINDYLEALQTVVTIEEANAFNIPRIAQLTQRTNQFNMTSRRYLEEDIRNLMGNKNFLVWSMNAQDKFGDNGIVGAAIVERSGQRWRIDTFLLSCRVIGRKIEEALLAHVIDRARRDGATCLIGEVIHTRKNEIARPFYGNNGFKLSGRDDKKETWEYQTASGSHFPKCVKLNNGGA